MAPAQEDATYLDRAYGDGVRVLLAEYDAAQRQIFAGIDAALQLRKLQPALRSSSAVRA
jgi:hypothetical protein